MPLYKIFFKEHKRKFLKNVFKRIQKDINVNLYIYIFFWGIRIPQTRIFIRIVLKNHQSQNGEYIAIFFRNSESHKPEYFEGIF